MQGQLAEKHVAILMRELAQKGASGLLRLSQGKNIKAIFFDSGAPVFAISNLASEQLETKLIKDGLITHGQLEMAKVEAGKPNLLGQTLIKMGIVTNESLRQLVRAQVMDIMLSLFEWQEGEYTFDDRIRAAHEISLESSASDVILECARKAVENRQVAELIAPAERKVMRAATHIKRLDSGKLMPVESYVLSRIETPTSVGEVGALSGLPDDDAQRAVSALVAAGFLTVLEQQTESSAPRTEDEATLRLRDDVMRKLSFYNAADYYEILGVPKKATGEEIKGAYYQLAKKYHPDRYRQSEDHDLKAKLEALFSQITLAYDTLRQPATRADYDERMTKSSPSKAPQTTVKATPMAPPAPAAASSQPIAMPAASQAEASAAEISQSSLSDSSGKAAAQPVVSQPARNLAPGQTAEHYFQQGRARFERKEYHMAVHLLREAVKLEPSKPQYHFHLGKALMFNPRTRREAEQHLAKAAELDPINAQVRLKLAVLYKESGLPKKAEIYFREALKIDPDNKFAKRELGLVSANKKDGGSIWKADLGSIAKRLFKK